MPPITGPKLQLARYTTALTLKLQPINSNPTGVIVKTCLGYTPHGRLVIARQVYDPHLPHIWPGRLIYPPDSESPFSGDNRLDEEGEIIIPNVNANALIQEFIVELYPT